MIPIKTPAELERMRASNRIAAEVLRVLVGYVRPGVSTAELDTLASEEMARRNARSAFLGYRGFPGHICVSLNEEVVHGIPGPRVVRIGDLVSLDVGVVHEGFVGDTATTVAVGVSDPRAMRLLAVAEAALDGVGGVLPFALHPLQVRQPRAVLVLVDHARRQRRNVRW